MLGFSPLSTAPVSALETVAPAIRLGQSGFVAAGTAVSGGSVKMYAPAAAFIASAVAASVGRRAVYSPSPFGASAVVSSTPHKRAAGTSVLSASATVGSTPHKRAWAQSILSASAIAASTPHKRAAGTSPFFASVTGSCNGKLVGFGSSFVIGRATVVSDGRRQVFTMTGYLAEGLASSAPTTAYLDMLTDPRKRRRYVFEIHPEIARARLAS